jgi:predicted RNA-binding protein with PUA-like domain
MRQMQVGDPVLFYHSSCPVPGVYGLAEVVAQAYPDPSQFQKKSDYFDPASKPEEPRWWCVDVGFVRRFAAPVTLERLKADAEWFGDFALLQRGNRLSVLPVTAAQYQRILSFE